MIDELNEGIAEVGVALHQQEDEARRRKIELEAEERKLEETLEYQRRIEDEAKQRHLAEQHKNNSRMTLMSMVPLEVSDVYKKHNIVNHAEDEGKPTKLVSLTTLIYSHAKRTCVRVVKIEGIMTKHLNDYLLGQ